MESLSTKKAPAAIGPYSQAMKCGTFLFSSGQIPLHPETGEMVGETLEEQTHQVFKNLKAVLEAAGLGFRNVVKTTVFLQKMSDFPQLNGIYAEYFGDHKPARSTVEVASLPKGALLEIDLIAQVS